MSGPRACPGHPQRLAGPGLLHPNRTRVAEVMAKSMSLVGVSSASSPPHHGHAWRAVLLPSTMCTMQPAIGSTKTRAMRGGSLLMAGCSHCTSYRAWVLPVRALLVPSAALVLHIKRADFAPGQRGGDVVGPTARPLARAKAPTAWRCLWRSRPLPPWCPVCGMPRHVRVCTAVHRRIFDFNINPFYNLFHFRG
jgi:hypothetical protein